jgi:DNA-binding IscR family transcriptional regulator
MATLPIFLVWIYIAWSVILFGAERTAAVQRGDVPPMLGPMSPDFLYSATMHILIRVADRAFHGGDEVTSWTLARELCVAQSAILPILDGLKAGGFVIEADSSAGPLNQGLFLARQSSTIVLADALKSVEFDQGASGGDPRVDRVLAKIGALRNDLLKTLTLEDIRSPEAKAVDREPAAIENKANH